MLGVGGRGCLNHLEYRRKLYRYCMALFLYCMALYRYRQMSFITKWYEATIMIMLDLDSQSRLSNNSGPTDSLPLSKKASRPHFAAECLCAEHPHCALSFP